MSSIHLSGVEVTADTFRLRPNADTSHESAEDWYDSYGAHVSTERGGDVCVQAVDYDWLDEDDDAVIAKLIEDKTYLPKHEEAEYQCDITEDEAASIVALARWVRESAEEIEGLLNDAVKAYESGDLAQTIEALEAASRQEGNHGDDPATKALTEQLLEPIPAEELACEAALAKLSDAESPHDYAYLIEELLQDCGTIYESNGVSPEDSASVQCVIVVDPQTSDETHLLRVADGVDSEWFGDLAACRSAVLNLWTAKTWQDGWDALGDGVEAPAAWE